MADSATLLLVEVSRPGIFIVLLKAQVALAAPFQLMIPAHQHNIGPGRGADNIVDFL